MRGYDYEVVGDKIAEMVGDFYERELEIRDAEIERLRQQNAELRELLQNWMGCCFVDEKNNNISFGMGVKKVWSETREAIAKATGGE